MDESYLEIKRDFVNTGRSGRSAVIKWRVAQNGKIAIDSSYTKFKNEDKNPSWPDGTRVSIFHNSEKLVSQEFEPNVSKEITKSLDVKSVTVKKGDYITMVVNGKENNAYDGGKYTFAIRGLSDLTGKTEKDISIKDDKKRTNNASLRTDFGKQGNNGWFYQYGYYSDPFFAVNVDNYIDDDKYTTKDGIEIKKDFIMPSTKDKSANVKWKVARNGKINIYLSYTKLKNEDANPSWPDGTIVTLMHNEKVLKKEIFGPDTKKEITKDLSTLNVNVKKGDYITMIVNGKDNTAYDGGLFSFDIEDANSVKIDKKNDSGINKANLASDFGEQGSNGWYYLEGRTIETSDVLTHKTEDKSGYISINDNDFEIKKDFVQPGISKKAMYQWCVAEDGKINILGNYVKFGHNDANPSWPDGTIVKVYINNKEIFKKNAKVLKGDGNNTNIKIELEKINVKKGDLITFEIGAKENNAWDGGKLGVQISPYKNVSKEFNPAPDNNANLFIDFGEQGNEGWYYGYGNSSKDFEFAEYNNGEYSSVMYDGLLLKKDGVHPSADKGAIYRWIVGEDGIINLDGTYFKAKDESQDGDEPDGVQVATYLNGTAISEMVKDVPISKNEEIAVELAKNDLTVKKGDKIDFIITAKSNVAWDYGKLQMKITDPNNREYVPDTDNVASLYDDFGEQGNKGWYYGMCDWDSTNFQKLQYDSENQRYYNNGKPELRKDYVEPGAGYNAAYKWVAGKDGKIKISGEYIKYPNSEDTNANGVCIRIFQNGEEKKWIGDGINVGGITDNVTVSFEQKLEVHEGDEIIFAVNPEGDDSCDGGKLAVDINPLSEEQIVYAPDTDNYANLYEDFGEQGNKGWYFGSCDWDSSGFELLTYDADNQRYYNDGKPELKKDYVEPGAGLNAAYKWIAGADGDIKIDGKYIKYPNSEDPNANGVCLRIFQNGEEKKWIGDGINVGGITENVTAKIEQELSVHRGDEIIFAVNPEGNDSWDGGKLSVKISPKTTGEDSGTDESDNPQEYVPDTDNYADLYEDFGVQGNKGWYYGACDWDSKGFELLTYDADNQRYYNDGKPELKKDYVEPGVGLNAAYKWIAGADGDIKIDGKYIKYPNSEDPNATGVCLRIFQNGEEKKWIGDGINVGGITENVTVKIEQELSVHRGDEIIFAVNPEGNDSYDGGKLSIKITPVSENSEPSDEPENPEPGDGPEIPNEYIPDTDNIANLYDDFGEQGNKGWYYGTCEWNGANFNKLVYDADNQRYFNNGKPELKKDFVEPGAGLNAAYKWIAGADGTISIDGEYVKFANNGDPNANGVCLRIFQNGVEKKWIGDGINIGGLSQEVKVTFQQELNVRKGDQIMFAVNPEGNDSWDGGRLSIVINPK